MLLRTLPALALLLGAAPAPAQFAIERPQQLAGKPVGGHLPIVHARIAGHDGMFLFDTGASDTVLSPGFAATLGLAGSGTVSGKDSGGNAVTGHSVAQVDIEIGTVRRHFERLAVVAIGPLNALGLDGVLSPQSLAGPDCLRIDFGKGVASLAAPTSPDCTLDGGAVAIGPDRRAHLTISGSDFLLDSGTWRTSLPTGFAPETPLLGSETHGGVAGTASASDLVGPVTLAIGMQPIRLDSARRAAPGKPGVLGFDLLSRATLVIRPGKDALLRVTA